MTKICIYGAGAIGGYLASALDQAGAEVSLVARGPHLIAIQEKGLRFEKDGQIFTHNLPASENPNEFGNFACDEFVFSGARWSDLSGDPDPPSDGF